MKHVAVGVRIIVAAADVVYRAASDGGLFAVWFTPLAPALRDERVAECRASPSAMLEVIVLVHEVFCNAKRDLWYH